MGLFSAHEIDIDAVTGEFGQHLVPGEKVIAAFRNIRDTAFLTNYRFVLVDVQGITGSKVEVLSVPYRAVTRFSVESAGTLDLDADLKIWVSGRGEPFALKISRKADAALIQQTLAAHVLGVA